MAEQERTVWCGNLGSEVTDEILYELFLQAGPLSRLHRPRDKETGEPRMFAFITFQDEESVPYALALLQDSQLFGRGLRIQAQGAEAKLAADRLDQTMRSRLSGGYHAISERPSPVQHPYLTGGLVPLILPAPIHHQVASVPDHLRPSIRSERHGARRSQREDGSRYDAPYSSRPGHDAESQHGGKHRQRTSDGQRAPPWMQQQERRRPGRAERDRSDWTRRQGRW